jgi:hypothetical protein
MKYFTYLMIFVSSVCLAETKTAKQAAKWNKKQVPQRMLKYDCKENLYCPYSKDDWKDVGSKHPKNKQFQVIQKMRELNGDNGYGASTFKVQ